MSTTTVVPIGDHHVSGVCTRWACGWQGTCYPTTWADASPRAEREVVGHLAERHLLRTVWQTLPTATLTALLDIVDDSTAEWDEIADEIARREDDEPHHDSPSLQDTWGTLPSYAS